MGWEPFLEKCLKKWFLEENEIFKKTSEWDYPARVMFMKRKGFLKGVLLGAKRRRKMFSKNFGVIPYPNPKDSATTLP